MAFVAENKAGVEPKVFVDGELLVEHIVLRHKTNDALQLLVVGIKVVAVDGYLTFAGFQFAAEQIHQSALA